MKKERKVQLLYALAKGSQVSMSSDERRELRKYRVDSDGEYGFYTTKKNIAAYVTAVDNKETRLAFRDWCLNKGYADRRRRGSSSKEVKKDTRNTLVSWALMGSIFWILCLGTLTGNIKSATIIGAAISLIMCYVSRKYVVYTNTLLPIAIIIIAGILRNK